MSQLPSIEIVSVEFKTEIAYEQQHRAMANLTAVISEFTGFISRQFYYSKDLNRWTDIVTWQDLEHAKAASEKIMTLPCAGEVFPLMVEETLIMGHFEQIS